jgi:hypothetical protein
MWATRSHRTGDRRLPHAVARWLLHFHRARKDDVAAGSLDARDHALAWHGAANEHHLTACLGQAREHAAADSRPFDNQLDVLAGRQHE